MFMFVHDMVVLSSVHVLIADVQNPRPFAFGSGCFLKYGNKFFFASVSHVTNYKDMTTFVETNLPPIEETVPIKPISGLYYYSMFKSKGNMTLAQFEEMLQSPQKPLDITFAEVYPPLGIFQVEMDFGAFKVERSPIVYLDLEDAAIPDKDETYAFFGRTRQDYEGHYLKRTHTFKHGLKFFQTVGNFHVFLAEEVIQDSLDYDGCSGAPILDSEGRIVALACKIKIGTKIIYGFSIKECKKLMDYTIQVEQLNSANGDTTI